MCLLCGLKFRVKSRCVTEIPLRFCLDYFFRSCFEFGFVVFILCFVILIIVIVVSVGSFFILTPQPPILVEVFSGDRYQLHPCNYLGITGLRQG